jgi:hypothetical protein
VVWERCVAASTRILDARANIKVKHYAVCEEQCSFIGVGVNRFVSAERNQTDGANVELHLFSGSEKQ